MTNEYDRRLLARLLLAGSAVVIIALALEASRAQPTFGGFIEAVDRRAENRSYTFTATNEELPYCVYASSKVSTDRPAPLVISLHGLGTGPGIMCRESAIDQAEAGGYIYAAPMGYNVGGWYGSPVIEFDGPRGRPPGLPENPANLEELSEQDVLSVLAMLLEEFSIDPDHIYLMGHSMGGAGALFLGSKHADQWAAIASIAPAAFLMNDNRAEILTVIGDADVPVLVVQGDSDELVPASNTRLWIETMAEIGVEHEYLEIVDGDHGNVIDIAMPRIFEFFGEHRR